MKWTIFNKAVMILSVWSVSYSVIKNHFRDDTGTKSRRRFKTREEKASYS